MNKYRNIGVAVALLMAVVCTTSAITPAYAFWGYGCHRHHHHHHWGHRRHWRW